MQKKRWKSGGGKADRKKIEECRGKHNRHKIKTLMLSMTTVLLLFTIQNFVLSSISSQRDSPTFAHRFLSLSFIKVT